MLCQLSTRKLSPRLRPKQKVPGLVLCYPGAEFLRAAVSTLAERARLPVAGHPEPLKCPAAEARPF